MKQAWYYSLKVWLTAVLTGPLGVMLKFYLVNDNELTDLEGYFLFVIFGMVFSIPSMLLLWFATYEFSKGNLPIAIIKTLLSIISVVLTFVAMALLSAVFTDAVELFISALYAVIIIGALWFYKLEPLRPKTENAIH